MIVILHDLRVHNRAVPGAAFRLSPSTELLGEPYIDLLAAQYRRLGAERVLWAGSSRPGAGAWVGGPGSGWTHLETASLKRESFGRHETVVIADCRLWPEQSLRDAILRHRQSASTLTGFVRCTPPSEYAELILPPRVDSGCTVVRRYGAEAGSESGQQCVALLARPNALAIVWAQAIEALAVGDAGRLADIARCAPMQVEGHPILLETITDYLALTGKMLAHADHFVAGTRRLADGVWAERGVEVERGSRIRGPILLRTGSRVASGASLVGPAVIGDAVTVGQDAFVGNSILHTGAHVPQGAQIWRSVVEDGAALAPNQPMSLSWSARGGCRRYGSTAPRIGFSSVVLPSRNALRRGHVYAYAAAKRVMDIAGALAGLALTLPLYPFIALAIKLETSGPVFFGHRRQTLGGREFGCLKFRSMVSNALALLDKLKNEVDGPQFHIENDLRLTRVGKFLRRTNLDEVPQFWNVLLGDMSLVGPRPSPDDENQFCPAWREARLSVRPGLTGLWQLRRTNRAGGDFHQWIQYDTQYVREASFLTDVKIIWETAVHMLKRI